MKTETESPMTLAPFPAAVDAEKCGDFAEAARLYKQAGDIAAGHTHAANMYAKARKCFELAAAPELLWAASWMLQFAEAFAKDHNDGTTMAACLDRARNAIAKAKGGAA